MNDYFKTLKIFSKMTPNEYFNWCDSHNFISLSKIYNDVMEAESNLTEYYESLNKENSQNIQVKDHADLTEKYIKLGLIKEKHINDSCSILVLANVHSELSRILSKDKLVSINDTIFQYNESNIKEIPNNDFSKIELLEKTQQTLADNSIIVKNETKSEIQKENVFLNFTFHWSKNNNHIFVVTAFERQYLNLDNMTFTTYFIISGYYQKRLFKNWKYRNATTTFSFPTNNYQVAFTYNSSSERIQSFSPYIPYYRSSYFQNRYIYGGYGGNYNNFIHTPHVYDGFFTIHLSCNNGGYSFPTIGKTHYLLK